MRPPAERRDTGRDNCSSGIPVPETHGLSGPNVGCRDKEAYAIVSALDKWGGWIGLQPVLVLADQKALEHWTTEISGPLRGSPAGEPGGTKSSAGST